MSRILLKRAVWCTGVFLVFLAVVLCTRSGYTMDQGRGVNEESGAASANGLPITGGTGLGASAPGAPAQDSQSSSDWTARVTTDIQRSEYHFSRQDDGSLSAPNRAHDLRARLNASGLRLTSRTKGTGSKDRGWELQMVLSAQGREGSLSTVRSAFPEVAGERVEFQRGLVAEWYVNDEKGLEQGFTLVAPPRVGPAEAPVILEMTLKSDLSAFLSEDGQSVVFKTAAGQDVMRYAGLSVSDARGRVLEASLAVLPGRLQIRIDDSGAAYPLTVDPLMTSPAWTAESNQKNAEFGISVATAGDVNGDGYSDVIVGAHLYDNGQTDEGRAFVFLGSASGLATTAVWTAESNQTGSGQNGTRPPELGTSVGTAGDVNGDGYSDVIVGAPFYDGVDQDEGRAFVWYGSGSGVGGGLGANGTPTNADWTGAPPCCDRLLAYYGYSVATAGDVNGDGYSDVIVGSYQEDDGIQSSEGRARVYHGSASGLSTSPAWVAEGNQSCCGLPALFGNSVATAGDVNGDGYSDVIVGAVYFDNGQIDEGRAFVFLGSASGLNTFYSWTAESDQANAYFGNQVATAGDVNGDGYSDVIVGATSYDNGETDEGRAFVFLGSASGLATTAAWTAEGNQASAFFGTRLATAGDVNGDGFSDVIIGATAYDNGQTDEGRAFVYMGSATGLATSPAWTAESDQASAIFGISVATAGDVNGDGFSDVIVGAYKYESASAQNNEGKAYVYHGSAAGLATSAGWTAESNQVSALFGRGATTAGDVNGDGYSDVILGAPGFDNDQSNEGRAFVYLGAASGLGTSPAWTAESDQADSGFGESVASAGDVNGDGYSDVIVGAWGFDNGQDGEGRAYVYLGSATGLAAAPAWTAESDQAGASFGYSVSTAGDVNGDGFSDVIVGAFAYSNGEGSEGRAFVYHGSATGLATSPSWTAESNQAGADFGVSVATAGDVNRDGFSDVIVGAQQYDNGGQVDEGRAFVYHGSASGLGTSPAWTAESDQNFAYFGYWVATAGDVNGDGYSDVIVGAPMYFISPFFNGRAYVYHGSATGLGTFPAWTADSTANNAWLGYSVATAGDVNGDGYSDVIVGAHMIGRAYVYHGSSSGLGTSPAWTVQDTGAFGWPVSGAGDVNGDGFSDVIVGATQYANGETDEGRAFVYYGNGGPGLSRIPNQARSDDTAPIALLGKSDATNAFRLHALGRTPAGRGKLRLVFEVKPLGTAFNGTGLGQGSLVDTGTPGSSGSAASLDETAGGLTTGTVYKWRLRTITGNAFFPRSPWFSFPYNGRTESDLRTP